MFKKGYRGKVTDLEKKMYYWLGEEAFQQFIDTSFEYDLVELKYLQDHGVKIDYHSPGFQRLCENNRQHILKL